jgi:hypothetical protein
MFDERGNDKKKGGTGNTLLSKQNFKLTSNKIQYEMLSLPSYTWNITTLQLSVRNLTPTKVKVDKMCSLSKTFSLIIQLLYLLSHHTILPRLCN